MSAGDHWRSALGAWVIPQHLLDAVEDSPYRWPVELFRRRNVTAEESPPPPTLDLVTDLAGAGGTVLDIGAGTGRASLPLAASGHRVTAVERSPAMAAALREEAAGFEESYRVVEAAWPLEGIGIFDVVLAAHVVYDVAEIEPFLTSMHRHARRGVVLELTETHPWTPLGPYYQALHDIDRPEGPTVEDLLGVVRETIGVEPALVHWERPGGTWFESWDEIEELYRRRLVLPAGRVAELRTLLGPDIEIVDGRMTLGDSVRRLATVWWRTDD
ncbi:MAG TPA: class I SAM-dependent methyltransferase [Acidimicrobiia bacterium]|nr:class I SAM-dependent methyltransferase [Acidimicrobiia bacterium]